ncbi:transporter substrate-binding domain-containing protein [bacterium]|nr:transporter substrate-binding domain-containing protein [bacterium]
MKSFGKRGFLLSLLISFFLIVANQLYALDLTIACENKADFPSITGNSDEVLKEKPGMSVEAVRLLEKKLNIKITIERLPWKRCLYELEQGKVDGVFTASFKEERKQFGRFPEKNGQVDVSRRFTSASYALYRLKGTAVSFDGTDFHNITGNVGAPSGYSIVDDLKKKGLSIDEGPSTEKDLMKLVAGRLQGVAALEMTGDFYLSTRKELGQKIEKVLPLIVMKPYYFMLSHQLYKRDPQLAEKIFDTLAEIREDPDFKKGLEKYLE